MKSFSRPWISNKVMFNPRQILYSTVITNNGKNSANALYHASVVAQHLSTTTRAPLSTSSIAAISTKDPALDWLKNITGKDEERLVGPRGDWWWTSGRKPTETQLQTGVSALPQMKLNNVTQKSLRNYFENSWMLTDILFSALQTEEAFYRPPYHHLRHPMIFYYGHPTSFYINKLRVAKLIPNGIDAAFEEIFEVGVDEMRWDDISTLSKDWPTVGEVNKYRHKAFQVVSNVIAEQFSGKETFDITPNDPLWALMMGIEHEKIHIETSSVLMRELPVSLLRRPEGFPHLHPSANKSMVGYPENQMVTVPATDVTLGKGQQSDTFGWDNEYGVRNQSVPKFQVSKYKVTNGEFLEFVKSGGYREERFWSEDGWGWRKFRNQKWPFFWQQRGPAGSHEYGLRTIFEVIQMPWSWPVNVNYHEASAFCRWKQEQMKVTGLRLITEAEHHALRKFSPPQQMKNSDLRFGSENPVGELMLPGDVVGDLFGNVWEWCEDDFNALDGFKVHPFYDDFSAPCFDGEHNMILGGSFMSCAGAGANESSRYHFRPHFLQHSGFRYVLPSRTERNIKGETIATFLSSKAKHSAKQTVSITESKQIDKRLSEGDNSYETERLLDQYMALHYGQDKSNVDATVRSHPGRPDHALNFAKRSAQLLIDLHQQYGTASHRALDVGCAVGAATFELGNHFNSVVGIDYSNSFVNKANEIKELSEVGEMKFQVPVQGNIYRSSIKASLPAKSLREKAAFAVGDATQLEKLKLGKFDGILLANLLCRLPDPMQCLDALPDLCNKDGVVLLVSPYSWLEEFTKKEKWLQTSDKMSAEVVTDVMFRNGFEKLHEEDVPLIIREHERKYQYIVSHAMAFRKK